MLIPPDIDDDVKKLILVVCPNSNPIYLPVEPEHYAQPNECFPSVAEKIKREGGSQILGWQIWKLPYMIEAEFHAIWKSPQGNLKDITPKSVPASKILFLPDPKANYTGAQVNNIYLNISGNELVDDIIRIANAIFKIQNMGERAFQNEFTPTEEDNLILKALSNANNVLHSMVQQGMTKDEPCFCGRSMNYRLCHEKELDNILRGL